MFLKGLLHAEEETLCLETAGKTVLLLSIMNLKGGEGARAPAFSRQHFSAVLCSSGRMIYIYFGSKDNWSSSPPSILALHNSFPPPKHSFQRCQNNCFMGTKCWAWSSNWDKLKITQQGREPWLLSQPRAALEPAAVGGREKGEGSKGTVSPLSHQ